MSSCVVVMMIYDKGAMEMWSPDIIKYVRIEKIVNRGDLCYG